jgi:Cu2+-exporting ATPase
MIKECSHCGNDTKNVADDFCCLGCAAAYKIVNKFGFENYYKLREIKAGERKIKPEVEDKIDISEFVVEKNNEFEVSLMIQGLHCAACVWLIEGILKKQQDVLVARINLSKKTLFIRWQGSANKGNELVSLIDDIGYKLLPFDVEILANEEKKYDNTILKALAVAGFGVGNIMLFSFSLWFFGVDKMGVETRNLLHFFFLSNCAAGDCIFCAAIFFIGL